MDARNIVPELIVSYLEHILSDEPLHGVNEDRGPLRPGCKHIRPRGFCPAGVRDVPVEVARTEVQPVFPGDRVASTVRALGVGDLQRILLVLGLQRMRGLRKRRHSRHKWV